MAQPRDTIQPLAEADMPPHLRQRLEEEMDRFHHPHSVDEDLAAASKRHDALIHSKIEHAHEQVEHAKQVAATHTSDPTHNAPTKPVHNRDDAVKVKEQSVQEK
ncbi:hypothetical protein Rt10032_c04g1859 [Rhodotorula toruloides]|uniref:Uncharacterized protein n=1 Tax=Rhodotorula toruloides TaxID=5286 RepID=A0A511KBY1_RHOTO|nr:hypothetical protein Rt10032_c04g1859 [Rhodotorula toruloides]